MSKTTRHLTLSMWKPEHDDNCLLLLKHTVPLYSGIIPPDFVIAPGQSPCSFVADCFPATVCSTACRKSALGSLANTARACVFPPRAYFAFHHRRAGGRECNLQRGRRARAPHADHCRGGSGGIEKEGVILERSLLTRGRRVFGRGIIASPACCGRIRVGRRHFLAVTRRHSRALSFEANFAR
jgi:hypothetical protein